MVELRSDRRAVQLAPAAGVTAGLWELLATAASDTTTKCRVGDRLTCRRASSVLLGKAQALLSPPSGATPPAQHPAGGVLLAAHLCHQAECTRCHVWGWLARDEVLPLVTGPTAFTTINLLRPDDASAGPCALVLRIAAIAFESYQSHRQTRLNEGRAVARTTFPIPRLPG